MLNPELRARMKRLFADAGITETPQHGTVHPRYGMGRAMHHEWRVVCQSVQTTAELEAGMSPERREQYAQMGIQSSDRPDEVTAKIGSWRRQKTGPDRLDAWIAHACTKVPDGYVPVRVEKGSSVLSSVMGPAELRSLRESVGYSIEDLTRELSVSRSIVQKWEAGKSPIPAGVATAVEDLQDAYQDAVEAAVSAGGDMVTVPRTDEESWETTGRPARWHRQIAAEVRLEHGSRIEWAAPQPARLLGSPTDHDPTSLLDELGEQS